MYLHLQIVFVIFLNNNLTRQMHIIRSWYGNNRRSSYSFDLLSFECRKRFQILPQLIFILIHKHCVCVCIECRTLSMAQIGNYIEIHTYALSLHTTII